ncbi:MAG TPA: hypothetical protein VGR22_02510 [Thermomicrobiales bacterium]|nr:hypothetical protein [Thermomicrobiales bacterium]
MRRERGFTAALAVPLALLLVLIAVLQPSATLAQTTATGQVTTQTVGNSTITYSDVWVSEPSVPEGLLLIHQELRGTLFLYLEYDEPNLDATAVLSGGASEFFSEFGDGNQEIVTIGGTTSIVDNVETRLSWQLYAVTQDSVPFGLLIAVDPTMLPGRAEVSLLLAPAGSFDIAMQAVLDTIDVNGTGSPLSGMDPEDLAEDLEEFTQEAGPSGPAATEPGATSTPSTTGGLTLPPLNPTTIAAAEETPAQPQETPAQPQETPAQTPGGLTLPPLNPTATVQAAETPTQAPGGLTLPPLGGTSTAAPTGLLSGSATVAGMEIRYSDAWVLDTENSTPGEILFLDAADEPLQFFGFLAQENAGLEAATALAVFNDVYFDNIGASTVTELAMETAAPGKAWSLHQAEIAGVPLMVLIYADAVSASGQIQFSLLAAEPAGMVDALTEAKASIQVGGVPAFNELDPSMVASRLGGGPATTPLVVEAALRAA